MIFCLVWYFQLFLLSFPSETDVAYNIKELKPDKRTKHKLQSNRNHWDQKTNYKKDEINSVELSNYNTEDTPTKSDKDRALLFISKQLNYNNRNDLKMYQDKTLESVFVKIISETHKDTIIRCIYKRWKLSWSDFTKKKKTKKKTLKLTGIILEMLGKESKL